MLVERVPIHLESLRYSEFNLWDLNFESFIKVSHISLCFRIVNRLPGNCLILYLFSVILRFQAFVCIYPYCIILPYSTILYSLFWTLIISKKLHAHLSKMSTKKLFFIHYFTSYLKNYFPRPFGKEFMKEKRLLSQKLYHWSQLASWNLKWDEQT